MRRAPTSAALVAALCGASGAGAQRVTVTGTVVDSLHGAKPLAGATVVINELARYFDTDSRGRFRFDSITPGAYSVTFLHPSLDSIDVAAGMTPLSVGAGGAPDVHLATPSPATVYERLCRAPRPKETGLVIGRVRDIDAGTPAPGAIVSGRWTEYSFDRGKLTPHVLRAVTHADERGVYVLCGVPADAQVDLVALANGQGAGPVLVPASEIGLARMNFGISARDAGSALAAETLGDTARQDRLIGTDPGSATVRGRVHMKGGASGAALVGILGSGIETRADSGGHFHLGFVPAGTRTLQVRSIGAAPVYTVLDVPTAGTIDTSVTLDPRAQRLAAAAVVASRPPPIGDHTDGFAERVRMGFGHFVTDTEIARNPSTQLLTVLGKVPTLKIFCPNGGKCDLYQNGGKNIKFPYCIPAFFLDGFKTTLQEIQSRVQNSEIYGVEVYNSIEAIPSRFDMSRTTGCGSVIVWTKFMAGRG